MAGLYLHIPFCQAKCIYCGFFSVATMRRKSEYLDALVREMQLRQHYLKDCTFTTLYFGGGTPTLLSINELDRLMEQLHRHFNISNDAEITIEANPEQLTPTYCKALRALCFNRLSIGIQSVQDKVLQFMGRRHTATEALQAVEHAAAAGFDNLSVDLIYGVAERQAGDWEKDLEIVFTLPVKHLSAYALTVEENSILQKHIQQKKHAPITDDLAANEFKQLLAIVPTYGFHQYEISNFCRPGWESKHNAAYWHQIPYLGLGASAHSYDGHSRQWNASSIDRYIQDINQGKNCADREELDDNALFNEAVLLGLRTCEGLSLDSIEKRFGTRTLHSLKNYFEKEVSPAFYHRDEQTIRLTEEGELFADGIAAGAFQITVTN